MAKKSKVKPKLKPKIKSVAKPKVKSKARAKVMTKTKVMKNSKVAVKAQGLRTKPAVKEAPAAVRHSAIKKNVYTSVNSTPVVKSATTIVKRVVNQLVERRRPVKRPSRINQFSFMKAPGLEYAFEVGGGVEVFCDHEKSKERIRGWVKGIVVQVDNKMVAVQFRSNVYLTDGWMVPDRILWFPLNSENMRPVAGKKPVTKDLIPDY